jgi:hypothetical protein
MVKICDRHALPVIGDLNLLQFWHQGNHQTTGLGINGVFHQFPHDRCPRVDDLTRGDEMNEVSR